MPWTIQREKKFSKYLKGLGSTEFENLDTTVGALENAEDPKTIGIPPKQTRQHGVVQLTTGCSVFLVIRGLLVPLAHLRANGHRFYQRMKECLKHITFRGGRTTTFRSPSKTSSWRNSTWSRTTWGWRVRWRCRTRHSRSSYLKDLDELIKDLLLLSDSA